MTVHGWPQLVQETVRIEFQLADTFGVLYIILFWTEIRNVNVIKTGDAAR